MLVHLGAQGVVGHQPPLILETGGQPISDENIFFINEVFLILSGIVLNGQRYIRLFFNSECLL